MAERLKLTPIEKVRAMLETSGLPYELCGEAVRTMWVKIEREKGPYLWSYTV